jgi:hypothetical protein
MLRNFKTPEIDDKLTEFCYSLSPKSTPAYIPFIQVPGAVQQFCSKNVKRHRKTFGGKSEYGWIIWYMRNIILEAEAHAIWIAKDGCKYDITPHSEETNGRIVFLPDDKNVKRMSFSGIAFPPNISYPYTESPLIKEYVTLTTFAKSKYFEKGHRDFSMIEAVFNVCTVEQRNRLLEIEVTFNKTVGRNDLCPCQSGLKYKKCCG